MKPLICLAILAALLPASTLAAPAAKMVEIKGATGRAMGQARLEQSPRGVLLRLEVSGLKPGWHGVHFHATGSCEGPSFDSAGSHVHAGATAAVHGLLNASGNDSGDLPNIHAGPDGVARADIFTTLVSLSGAGGRPSLTDVNGSALVVHENPDDYQSQPIGGAGARVACGVVR